MPAGKFSAAPRLLHRVLNYRNADVVDRYLRDYGGTRRQAEPIFRALLKWFYLASVTPSCPMSGDLSKLDDMWHTFLLFTWDYTKFCERYFGEYLHHIPKTARDRKASKPKVLKQMRAFYETVYDVLGETTFREWFFDKRFAK